MALPPPAPALAPRQSLTDMALQVQRSKTYALQLRNLLTEVHKEMARIPLPVETATSSENPSSPNTIIHQGAVQRTNLSNLITKVHYKPSPSALGISLGFIVSHALTAHWTRVFETADLVESHIRTACTCPNPEDHRRRADELVYEMQTAGEKAVVKICRDLIARPMEGDVDGANDVKTICELIGGVWKVTEIQMRAFERVVEPRFCGGRGDDAGKGSGLRES
ncbi:uncharacterized protein MYCFIDRAFT_201007 [Pseudocercospora fijiensis CIRAD86]|uniref:Uncharacterized protein n=1 Tax=Pseudocercospora fijiensis (strain CIRAD86) TaxID=383855 RepID=M3AHU9_PSEFD|nr:uncharacterized protein MYCFIDRAFT_201007 [Pseudocercospora fijiensis CIRAD86]EME76768.1 hypothetical protein MYCFIDRAFT_201007 [Pseudocercospora fijiensis CIRAD86]